jgi:hypothetical protein
MCAIIPCVFIPLLFIQRGVWFDTAQFLVIGSFMLSIFAAEYVYLLIQKKHPIIFIGTIIALCLFFSPTIAHFHLLFDGFTPLISQSELTALEVLRKQPEGIVFYPIVSVDSPYINLFSEKQSYLSYVHVLDNVGIRYQDRAAVGKRADVLQLARSHVEYLYIPKTFVFSQRFYFAQLNRNIKLSKKYDVLYVNTGATVYRLKK